MVSCSGCMTVCADALYDLSAARSEDQRRYMDELEASGICIFCSEEHRAPVELSGKHWYVVENDYPYAGTRAHYLIVPYAHVSSFDELPDDAGADLWALKRALRERLNPVAVATVERSGDMRYNGGSVAHLHVHFVALETAPARTVKFRVSARGASEA
jgi:ATP adenylyltransferase